MSINLIKIKGQDEASSVRIIINDDLEIIGSAINDIDSILSLSSGNFDNTAYNGSTIGSLKTGDVNSVGTTGITIQTGNLIVTAGKITFGSATAEIDMGQHVKINKVTYPTSSGTSSGLQATSFIKFAPYTSASINDIQSPDAGVVLYNSSTNKLIVRTASGWENLN